MPRRSRRADPESIRQELLLLLQNFQKELKSPHLRAKVKALVLAFHKLHDLGSSLITAEGADSGRDRMLFYFKKYPRVVIEGDELMVVAGIGDWPRRVRELRVEFGWPILSGVAIKEMFNEGDFPLKGIDPASLKVDNYLLTSADQDREAAYRWKIANVIRRRKDMGVQQKVLEFLKQSLNRPVMGEELRYVANGKTEWARRVRELRTEEGWPVVTKFSGRPDLPVGSYVLEQNRQSPPHDRQIPDHVRRAVLVRDKHRCQQCGWHHEMWNKSDPRHLELHHITHHVQGGKNSEDNLKTLCTVCHDKIHSRHS